MADNLKVFTDRIFTGADVVGDTITIASTDATTKAVIKDVQYGDITDTVKDSSLTLGTVNLIDSLVNVSGSQIMGNEESLNIKLPTSVQDVNYKILRVTKINSTTEITTNTLLTSLETTDTIYQATVPRVENMVSETLTVPVMYQPVWVHLDNDYVYYKRVSGSTTNLYRASINAGIVGSWSTIDSTSLAYKCADRDSGKVYWNDNGNLNVHDMGSNSTSVLATGLISNAGSTYYSISAVVDDYFFCNSNTPSRFQVVKLSTGNVLELSAPNSNITTHDHTAMAAVKDGTYYYVYTRDGANIQQHYITIDDLENGVLEFTQGATNYGIANSNTNCMSGNTKGELTYIDKNKNIVVEKVSPDIPLGNNILSNIDEEVYSTSGVMGFESTNGINIPRENLDISIACRVSGIEVSEV